MSAGNLTKKLLTQLLSPAIASGTSTQTFNTIDMKGYRGVRCIVLLGDVVATAVPTLQAYQGLKSDGTDKALLSVTAPLAAAGASNYDNGVLILDIYKPMQEFLTFELVRATANIPVQGVLLEYYEPRNEPILTQDPTVINATMLVEPDFA